MKKLRHARNANGLIGADGVHLSAAHDCSEEAEHETLHEQADGNQQGCCQREVTTCNQTI